jgi:predicted dehydrogenase
MMRTSCSVLKNGARGILTASQIEIGHENDFRIRIFGTKASLEWHQENPNDLWFKPDGQPAQLLRRGNGYLCDAAKTATRLPAGHPEAFIEAFANVYLGAAAAIRASGGISGQEFDYPTVYDGARGVHFIEKTVESSRSDRKWTDATWQA